MHCSLLCFALQSKSKAQTRTRKERRDGILSQGELKIEKTWSQDSVSQSENTLRASGFKRISIAKDFGSVNML